MGYGYSVPRLGLTWTRYLFSALWPQLVLMTLVPHVGLNLDLVTVVPTWVSPESGDSRSHMNHTWTW